jgi:hypothetical protein
MQSVLIDGLDPKYHVLHQSLTMDDNIKTDACIAHILEVTQRIHFNHATAATGTERKTNRLQLFHLQKWQPQQRNMLGSTPGTETSRMEAERQKRNNSHSQSSMENQNYNTIIYSSRSSSCTSSQFYSDRGDIQHGLRRRRAFYEYHNWSPRSKNGGT